MKKHYLLKIKKLLILFSINGGINFIKNFYCISFLNKTLKGLPTELKYLFNMKKESRKIFLDKWLNLKYPFWHLAVLSGYGNGIERKGA
ncbi:MAG: hypothetical protein ACP5E3_06260 [Bacteroidales bacterium]